MIPILQTSVRFESKNYLIFDHQNLSMHSNYVKNKDVIAESDNNKW
jgi:hypothetical protein